MKEKTELDYYSLLIRLRLIFKLVQQLSWIIAKTEKRYPTPEDMTNEDVEKLAKLYLSLGHELKDITEKWEKMIKENE